MAATGHQYLWAFIRYAKANPHSHLNSVHWDEIEDMAGMYGLVNATDATSTGTDPGTYSAGSDIPGRTTANTDTNGVGFQTPTTALTDQAMYPQTHIFTAQPA
jgi:hypothetical protein